MLIAVFSDSHDHLPNLEQAIAIVKEQGISTGFHLGDFCAPFSIKLLADSGIHWQCVWGNNDGDTLSGYIEAAGSLVRLERRDFLDLEIANKHIFLTHYPQIARIAALSGQYHACFFGHNHTYSSELIGETLLANPGEILGYRSGNASFGIYNTETTTMERVLLA